MKYSFLCCCLLAFASQEALGQNVAEKIRQVESNLMPWIQKTDSAWVRYSMEERLAFYKVPSLSIAVINDYEVEWTKAYGFSDLAERHWASDSTIYQAASLSKSLHSFCVHLLAQDGKLPLDEDIRPYLKSWKIPENSYSKGQKITIQHLLSHTAGFNKHGFENYEIKNLPTLDELLRTVKPVAYPGRQVQYSGGGYLIAQKILEDNIGSNYEQLMQDKVLRPLGMSHSTFDQRLPNGRYAKVATAYDGDLNPFSEKYLAEGAQAAGGLWCTPRDMAKFVIQVQKCIEEKPGALLSKSLTDKMLSPMLDSTKEAMGFFIEQRGGRKYFQHSGSNTGYKCLYYGSFEGGTGIVLMTNSDNDGILDEVLQSFSIVYGWNGFYKPSDVTQRFYPDSVTTPYLGTYSFGKRRGHEAKRAINFMSEVKISKVNGRFFFQADEDIPEEMFFYKPNKFVCASNTYIGEFEKSKLKIKYLGNVFVAEKR
jgi:CubicO group peptidase (beta-lactamase class C family)